MKRAAGRPPSGVTIPGHEFPWDKLGEGPREEAHETQSEWKLLG